MKVAFLIESFLPFGGGSEWSTFYLAADLTKKDIDVVVITPNLGAKETEIINKVIVLRFPFYLKFQNKNNLPGNFSFTNPLWIIWASVFYFIFLKRENPDIIHVQGKYSLIPARIANLFLGKPLVVTIRDYQIICNYGFCLLNKNKACNFFDYFSDDFVYYLKHYLNNQKPLTLFLNVLYAIWGRTARNLIRLFGANSNVVVLSKKQEEIFLANGFKRITVIGNSFSFQKRLPEVKKQNAVLFAGRLTSGKGVGLLINILPSFFKDFPDYKFYFVGEGNLKNKLKKMKKNYHNLFPVGQMEHKTLLTLMAKAKLLVMPSIWPEPFGRIALESISQGTPVVASKRGGLPEIISDGKYGLLVNPMPRTLLEGLKKAMGESEKYQDNIKKDFEKIKKQFQEDITSSYTQLYRHLIK